MPIRALIVDDDHKLAELLAAYLRPHDVVVTHAPDGARALVAVEAGGVDLGDRCDGLGRGLRRSRNHGNQGTARNCRKTHGIHPDEELAGQILEYMQAFWGSGS